MEKVIYKIKKEKIISIVRTSHSEDLELVIDSLYKAGIRIVEVTLNTPNAFKRIQEIKIRYPDMLVGAGTVLDEVDAKLAINSGANFLLSPILDKRSIELANRHNTLLVPGVLTPTEAFKAYKYGARMIKLFPARNLTPDYISDMKGPLPELDIMAVGGISLENAEEFIDKGSCSLGVGSSIVNDYDIKNKNYKLIQKQAEKFIKLLGR